MKKFLLVILLCPLFGLTQEFSVKANKTNLLIGEPSIIELNFSVPSNIKFDTIFFKLMGEDKNLGNNWEIWNKSPIDTLYENGNFTNYIQKIEIANFDTGKFEFPPLIAYVDQKKYFSNSLYFNIKLEETESDEIKPIKPIKHIDLSWLDHIMFFIKCYWIWILIFIASIIIVLSIIKKWFNKTVKIKEKVKIPLSTTLLKELDKLEKKEYWQNGNYKKYYSDLAEIIWRFIEDRYDVSTYEKTSNEILNSLKWKNISDDSLKNIKYFFSISDDVKFAKQIPNQKDNVESFNMIKHFIENERLDIQINDDEKNISDA